MGDELKDYHVRLPIRIVERLPAAKIIARKSIQMVVKEALEKELRTMKLL